MVQRWALKQHGLGEEFPEVHEYHKMVNVLLGWQISRCVSTIPLPSQLRPFHPCLQQNTCSSRNIICVLLTNDTYKNDGDLLSTPFCKECCSASFMCRLCSCLWTFLLFVWWWSNTANTYVFSKAVLNFLAPGAPSKLSSRTFCWWVGADAATS